MKLMHARFLLFSIWVGVFVTYLLLLFCTSFKRGVTSHQASQAAWTVGYAMLPVLLAFASFFFAPLATQENERARALEQIIVRRDRLYAMLVLTALVHLVVLFYFVTFLLAPDWADEGKQTTTFDDTLADGLKWLALLSSLAVIPVGWILNPESPTPVSLSTPPGPTPPSPDQPSPPPSVREEAPHGRPAS